MRWWVETFHVLTVNVRMPHVAAIRSAHFRHSPSLSMQSETCSEVLDCAGGNAFVRVSAIESLVGAVGEEGPWCW
jgi:hypothetical protein